MEQVIAKESAGSSIPPHPQGQYAARCIDLIDYGMVQMTWQGRTKEKHRICLRFWCGEFGKDGEGKEIPLWVDAWFTLTLDERGSLRPFLQAWRGQAFTGPELAGFNVAVLVGVDAMVQVSHNVKGDRTYANIDSIMRLPKGMAGAGDLSGYVRVKDRPKEDAPATNGSSYSEPDEDDGLPF
jgi:hypothetical protein